MTALLLLMTLSLPSPEAPLEPLNSRLERSAGLSGEFTRTDYLVLTMESDTSRGSFLLASPNLFLLDFCEPDGKLIGFDGDRSYTVEPATRQVVVYRQRSPDSFVGTLRSYDDSSMVDSMTISGDSVTVWLQGAGAGIETVTAGYTLSDSLPFLYATADANGNTITYRLHAVEAGPAPDEAAFDLHVPEGYSVASP